MDTPQNLLEALIDATSTQSSYEDYLTLRQRYVTLQSEYSDDQLQECLFYIGVLATRHNTLTGKFHEPLEGQSSL